MTTVVLPNVSIIVADQNATAEINVTPSDVPPAALPNETEPEATAPSPAEVVVPADGQFEDAGESTVPDVVAIIPDRSTAYANGIHNGLRVSAHKLNISLEIQTVGNFEPGESYLVLQRAIENPVQPKIYIIWPIDLDSKIIIKQLFQTHQVPIIQINQIPSDKGYSDGDTEWELAHLLGYAGQSDAERASNAGQMMVEAMAERKIEQPFVVALGYPRTYAGFHVSEAAFREAIAGSPVQLVESLPIDWGSQNAYDQMLIMLDSLIKEGIALHGIYAMDDDILKGAYQAIEDRRKNLPLGGDTQWVHEITLVGTVCNGARSLLEDGKQYGTTVQSPLLEAILAMDSVNEYLTTGNLTQRLRYTPNPIIKGSTVESLIIPFLGETYAADDLCTWNLNYVPSDGLFDKSLPEDLCLWVECSTIPDGLVYTGYVFVAINFSVALICAIVVILFRRKRVMTLAQPPFLLLVILASIVDTSSILFMSEDNITEATQQKLDSSCYTWPWLLALGQTMTTTTLVAKIYRVKKVMEGAAAKNSGGGGVRGGVMVSVWDVSSFILGGLAVDAIILAVWFATDPLRWQIQIVSQDAMGHILSARGTCASEGQFFWIYPTVLLILHFAMLIHGNLLAYGTRQYHRISDSKTVAVSLFNSIQLLLVATIMFALSGDNVTISYVVRACYAFANNLGVLVLVVLPKVYGALFVKEAPRMIGNVSSVGGVNSTHDHNEEYNHDFGTGTSFNNHNNVMMEGIVEEVDVDAKHDAAGTSSNVDHSPVEAHVEAHVEPIIPQ